MSDAQPAILLTAQGQTSAEILLTVALTCVCGEPPTACLEALADAGVRDMAVICLCPACLEAPTSAQGLTLLKRGVLRAFDCLPLTAGQSPRAAVNRLAVAAASPFLLLLSSDALLEKESLPPLLARLAKEAGLAGVNPLLLAPGRFTGESVEWRADEFAAGVGEIFVGDPDAGRRILHLGSVADSQGHLHYLYENLPVAHPLAARRRAFQIGHEAALLLRREDFTAVGGFRPELEALAGADLCLRLAAAREGVFSSEPTARALLRDGFDSWKSCGLWNSLLERGRLQADLLRPDYPRHVRADGLEYGITGSLPWLVEGPCTHPLEKQKESLAAAPLERAWLRWRSAPEPVALLELLPLLPSRERDEAVRLCRELPSSLPRTLDWYKTRASRLAEFGGRAELPLLMTQARQWMSRAEAFGEQRLKPGLRSLVRAGLYACPLDDAPSMYDAWQELAEPEDKSAGRGADLEVGRAWPGVAVLMPVWNSEPGFLRAALDSVLAQSYENWRLCLADDASTRPETPEILRAYAARESRIRLVRRAENGHISHASNSALALVEEPWAALLDHDDLLAPGALLEVARAAAERPGAGFIYSDEDKVDARGVRRNPYFKPDFDPDLYDGCNYTCHLSAFETRLLREAGGFRPGFEGSQDYDLTLRVVEKLGPDEIVHIPRILYHWRVHAGSSTAGLGAKPYVLDATRRALAESLRRRGVAAEIAPAGKNNFFRLLLPVPPELRLSIVLLVRSPQRLAPDLGARLRELVRALRLPDLEILWQPLAKDAAAPPEDMPRRISRVLPPAGPDWATACNVAVRAARGEIVLFLDAALAAEPDCRPGQLAALALRPDLAMVGGCIRKGRRLWHAGLYPDASGLPFPLQRGASLDLLPSQCWGQLLLARRVLAVSPRCMALRREVFLRNKGFDAALGALAGADYSLRLAGRGLASLVTPWGQWRLPRDAKEEKPTPQAQEKFLERWGELVRHHGARNPHLRAAPDGGSLGWTLDL